jgi:hypothetical protein
MAWVAALLGAAVGLCGWATLGSASRRAPGAHAQVAQPKPGERGGSLESLRWALARAVVTNGLEARAASEQEKSTPTEAQAATTDAEPDSEEADEPESSEDSPAAEETESSDDPGDEARVFSARFRNWRSWYYRHHRPYWYGGSYETGSDGEQNDEEGPAGGWAFPAGAPLPEKQASPSGQAAASTCPLDPRRWLVRLQGRPISPEPGPGLVCLTDAPRSSGGDRLSLLKGLVRLIARSSPAPDRVALVVHRAALGVLVPPPLDGDPARLAASLQVLGLGDQVARATAVVNAFGPERMGSGGGRKVVPIGPDLSLVVMGARDLAGLVASEHDGSGLRQKLGVDPSPAARDTSDAARAQDPAVPTLPSDAAIGVELDGCPPPSRGGGAVASVNSALCVGDGKLVGGSEGNTATMFYELEATRDLPRTSAS